MNNFCTKCGAPLKEGDVFCEQCGERVEPTEAPAQPVYDNPPPVQPTYNNPPREPQVAPPAYPPSPKKSRKGLVIGLVALVVVLAAAALVVFLVPGISKPVSQPVARVETVLAPMPSSLVYEEGKTQVQCNYDAPDVIIPAIYRSMDYIAFLKCWSDNGAADLLVSVEIPDFTQKYEQKITVTRAETQLKIHPPLVEGVVKTLNSSKNAQLVVSVKNLDTGEIVIQDSKPVKIYSRYDMQWQSADGTPYYENFLAWLTPEAPEIKSFVRASADALGGITNGQINAIVGYQDIGLSQFDTTYYQAAAMMYTLAKTYQVKYVATPFSSTSSDLQRVATPAEVLNGSAGLCAETAVTIASALQATQMHAVLILLPGHMQTAVETWRGSGEYLLIETTALDLAASGDLHYGPGKVFQTLTKDEWTAYVSQEGYECIDCDLAATMQIQSID